MERKKFYIRCIIYDLCELSDKFHFVTGWKPL